MPTGPHEAQALAAGDRLLEAWWPDRRLGLTLEALDLLVHGADLDLDADLVRAAVIAADLVGRRRGWLDGDEVAVGDLSGLVAPEVLVLVEHLAGDDGGPGSSAEVRLVGLAGAVVEAVEAGREVSEDQAAAVLRQAVAVPELRGRALASMGWPMHVHADA